MGSIHCFWTFNAIVDLCTGVKFRDKTGVCNSDPGEPGIPTRLEFDTQEGSLSVMSPTVETAPSIASETKSIGKLLVKSSKSTKPL